MGVKSGKVHHYGLRPAKVTSFGETDEAAFHFIAAGVLYWLWRRQLFRGRLIKLYILSYLVYRFAGELIRPEARLATGRTGYPWAALILFPLFSWLWWREQKAVRGAPESAAE